MTIGKSTKLIKPGKWYTEFDENGNVTRAVYDESFRELLGFGGEEEYDGVMASWMAKVHPDDAARLKEYLADTLSRHPEGMDFDIEYRMLTKSGYHWFHDYGHFSRREDGSVIHCDGVVFDLQATMDNYAAAKAETVQREMLLAPFIEKYGAVYAVNLKDDTFKVIKRKQEVFNLYGKTVTNFSTGLAKYIEDFVIEADRQLMRRETDFSVIAERLKHDKRHFIEYRAVPPQGGNVQFHEMIVAPTGKENEVLFAIVANEFELIRKNLSEKHEEDYFALYEIDLDTELAKVIKESPWYAELKAGQIVPYRSGMLHFASIFAGQTRAFFEQMADMAYIKRQLAAENKRTFTYRSTNIAGGRWAVVTAYVLKRHEDGSPAVFTLGFSFMDTVGGEQQELQQKLAEQKEKLENSLEIIKREKNRFEVVKEIIHSAEWSMRFSADDELISTDFSGDIERVINHELATRPVEWKPPFVHPDDYPEAEASYLAAIADHSDKTPYEANFRMLDRNGKYNWFQVAGRIRTEADGTRELFGIHININDRMEEEQKRLLGTVKLSLDVLSKANIGLWSFELDEGRPPRMYVDDTMLGLIGLDHQVPPEETYHAWYDRIDKDSYGLVTDAVEKMSSGEHAEVQYPWHHPDGHTMIVRCGGIRNFGYTAGIRVEGTHQNVSEVLHFDEEESARLKQAAIQLQFEQLRSDALNEFVVDTEADPVELLEKYAKRLRELIGCDQVLYCDLEETRVIVNAPELGENWTVPVEYCRKCLHSDMHHPMYKDGYTEMYDCQEGWLGIPVYKECPVKSALTRLVYCDNEIVGYMAVNYIQDYHRFTDIERSTLEEITRILSISLSRYKARKENKELKLIAQMKEQLQESLAFTDYFLGTYVSAYYVGLDDESCEIYKRTDELEARYPQITSYFVSLNEYIENEVHTEDREALRRIVSPENLKAVLKDNPEIVHVFRDISGGTEKIYRLQIIRGADEAHAALGFKDITEEVHEEQKRQRELAAALASAETANKSKSSFLFNMSHDIRTPMNAITGFTAMAKKYLADRERVEDYLNKIDASGQQLLGLVNQVLEMSRIEAGKVELNNQPVNIKEKYDSLVTILSAQAGAIDLEFNASLDITHYHVMADEARMAQIVLNIAGNALKYTPHGGKVDFSFKEIPCDKEGRARYTFIVADTGIGMSEEFQKTIFEPFSREKSSTVSKIQGTGLGMSIVKDLVDLLGGTIEVQSELGKGTRFDITLEFEIIDEAEEKAAEESRLQPASLEGKRILLVEDNELNREIAKDILEEFGLVVEEADDGDVAVAMVKAADARGEYGYYDLVLMDIQMPKLNGYDATRAIRALPEPTGSHLPIIAMTANAFAEDRKNAFAAGMDGHLAKPIDIGRLLETLVRFCN